MSERVALTADEASQVAGIGKSSLYAAARRGDLEVRWVGRQKFVVQPEQLRKWIERLPTVRPGASK